MTAFVLQTLLVLGAAYLIGCWLGCKMRRVLTAKDEPVPVTVDGGRAMPREPGVVAPMPAAVQPTVVQRAAPSTPDASPVREAFRRADTLSPPTGTTGPTAAATPQPAPAQPAVQPAAAVAPAPAVTPAKPSAAPAPTSAAVGCRCRRRCCGCRRSVAGRDQRCDAATAPAHRGAPVPAAAPVRVPAPSMPLPEPKPAHSECRRQARRPQAHPGCRWRSRGGAEQARHPALRRHCELEARGRHACQPEPRLQGAHRAGELDRAGADPGARRGYVLLAPHRAWRGSPGASDR